MKDNNQKSDWKHRFLSGWGLLATIIFGTIAALTAVKMAFEI
ncbi:MAG: hypothetical protein ACJ77K_14585 [Bacteroidia bacterium]